MKYTRLSICFKEWLNLHEVIDANTENSLKFQKDVDPQALSNFINTLKAEPELIDKTTAFKRLLSLRSPKAEKQETPQDPFLLNYYNLLKNNQITKSEYNIVGYFLQNGADKNLLKSIMDSLRKLIQEGKIDLNFANNIPTIVDKSNNKSIKINDFNKFSGYVHAIEAQETTNKDPNLADPVFLEVSHNEKLVAKSKDGKIWVFKATSPIDCRSMGKGQNWCIASSSSAKWYFHYRHEYGQTQYFIFDFNKDKDDPARYVNPGVSKDGYSEWVDAKNDAIEDENGDGFGINGYANLEEYLGYLNKHGISRNIFKADPISKEETDMKDMIDEYDDGRKETRNFIFDKVKNNPALLNQFLQLIEKSLDEDHYNQLSESQKKLYISNLEDETLSYFLYHAENRDLLIKDILKYKGNNLSDNNVENLLSRTKYLKETMKEILKYKNKNLSDNMISQIIYYASNLEKDERNEISNAIIEYKGKDLSEDHIADFIEDSLEPDETAKQIIKYKEDNLTPENIYYLLRGVKNVDEIAEMIGKEKISQLNDNWIRPLIDRARNKGALINIILKYKPSHAIKMYLFGTAKDKYEMAEKILDSSKNEVLSRNIELIKYFLDMSDDRYKMAKLIMHKAPMLYQAYKNWRKGKNE